MEAKQEQEHNYQNGVTLQTIKLNERSNIIYGKLTKATPNCSSFKPKQSVTPVAAPQVANVETQAEVYQNIGDDLEAAAAKLNESKQQEETTEEASGGDDHNYMNC